MGTLRCQALCFSCVIIVTLFIAADSQLTADFYASTCPRLLSIVRREVKSAIREEPRMAASLLRLHFHDCFVTGCDGSVLLDGVRSEKFALPNLNSARGFEIVDTIKDAVESECPEVVSCADILAIAARDSVYLSGGRFWRVLLGRRDGLVSDKEGAGDLPSPFDPLDVIISKFESVGLDIVDLVTLSGAHTMGRARCVTFRSRLFNFSGTGQPDYSMDTDMVNDLQDLCSGDADGNATAPLDWRTRDVFDKRYFQNLVNYQGLLSSDQILYSDDLAESTTKSIVESFSDDPVLFLNMFAKSMIKMGNINPLTGKNGEIRQNCWAVNSQ